MTWRPPAWPGDDRIISAAVYRLDALGEVEDHWSRWSTPSGIRGPVWIHGLTSEVLDGAPLFGDIAEEFAARLDGRVLVAHNAVFDWQMIAREYSRVRREAPVRQRLCTIALSKELGLPLPNHKLESLAAHFGVVQQRAHHALDDARVLAEAFRPIPPGRGGERRTAAAAGVPAADGVVGPAGAPAGDGGLRRLPVGQLAPLPKGPHAPIPTRGATKRQDGSNGACGWPSPRRHVDREA